MKTSPKKEPQKAFCYSHYLNPASEVHPEFVRFDCNPGRQGYDYGSHRHPDHELIVVERGRYDAVLNGAALRLREGQMLLVCPGDVHADQAREGLVYFSLSFFLRSAAAPDGGGELALLLPGTEPGRRVFPDGNERIAGLMKEAAAVMEQQSPGAAQLAQILLHEIFWRLVQKIPENNLSPEFSRLTRTDDFALKFQRAAEECVLRGGGLEELAARLAVSPSQLNKLCNRHLQISPARRMMALRLGRAAELLSQSDLSVREISERLHFRDQFEFSRAFKHGLGVSPLAFRSKRSSDPDWQYKQEEMRNAVAQKTDAHDEA